MTKLATADDQGREHRRPTHVEESELDCRIAMKDLEVAELLFRAVASDPDRIDRRAMLAEAREKVALVARFAESILKRSAR